MQLDWKSVCKKGFKFYLHATSNRELNGYFGTIDPPLTQYKTFQKWLTKNHALVHLDSSSRIEKKHFLYIYLPDNNQELFILDFYQKKPMTLDETFVQIMECTDEERPLSKSDCEYGILKKSDLYLFSHEDKSTQVQDKKKPAEIEYKEEIKDKKKPAEIEYKEEIKDKEKIKDKKKPAEIEYKVEIEYKEEKEEKEEKIAYWSSLNEDKVDREEEETSVTDALKHFTTVFGIYEPLLFLDMGEKIRYRLPLDHYESNKHRRYSLRIAITLVDKEHLMVLRRFSDLNLYPPVRIFQPRRDRFVIQQTPVSSVSLLNWLKAKPKRDLNMILQLLQKKITQFQAAGLSCLDISVRSIHLVAKDQLYFMHLDKSHLANCGNEEYYKFAHSIDADWVEIPEEYRLTLRIWVTGQLENQRWTTILEKSRSVSSSVVVSSRSVLYPPSGLLFPYDQDFFIRRFVVNEFGHESLNLFPDDVLFEQNVKWFPYATKHAFIFLLSHKRVLKLAKTNPGVDINDNNDESININKLRYEILMQQKFLMSNESYRMAPLLYDFNLWKLPNDCTVVGFCSEKIQMISEKLKHRMSNEEVKQMFANMYRCYINMCKAGLWHFDGHLYNWGLVDGHEILFDYEFATDEHPQKCKWNHELLHLGKSFLSQWESYFEMKDGRLCRRGIIHPLNWPAITKEFREFHKNLLIQVSKNNFDKHEEIIRGYKVSGALVPLPPKSALASPQMFFTTYYPFELLMSMIGAIRPNNADRLSYLKKHWDTSFSDFKKRRA